CNMTSGYQNSLVFRYLDTFPRPLGLPVWPELIPEPTPEGLEHQIKAGHVCIGTPDEVTRAVKGYADVGADQLTFGMLSTTMPVDIAIEAVETFGRDVDNGGPADQCKCRRSSQGTHSAANAAPNDPPGQLSDLPETYRLAESAPTFGRAEVWPTVKSSRPIAGPASATYWTFPRMNALSCDKSAGLFVRTARGTAASCRVDCQRRA